MKATKNHILIGLCMFALVLPAIIIPGVIAPTATTAQPTVNATFYENVTPQAYTMIDAFTAQSIPITSRTPLGATVVFDVTTLVTILTTPNSFLNDATYRVSVTARDAAFNSGTYNWSFDVKLPGQNITYCPPSVGGFNTSDTDYCIKSEFGSTCYWDTGSVRILNRSMLSNMKSFPNKDSTNNTHTQPNIINTLGITSLTNNQKISLVVSCDDGQKVSSAVLPLTYYRSGPVICTNPSGCSDVVCGDNKCQFPENATSCAKDCAVDPPPPLCGNNKCEYPENATTCSKDCVINSTTPLIINRTLPVGGVTDTTNSVTFQVTTNRPATCKYRVSNQAITTSTGFTSMSYFPQTGQTTHTLTNFYQAISKPNPVSGDVTYVAVSCQEGTQPIVGTTFTVNYRPNQTGVNYQNITLLIPANGQTTSTSTPISIRSSLSSTCYFNQSAVPVNTSTGVNSMVRFATTGATTHNHNNFYQAIGKAPTSADTTSVALTCVAGGVYSSIVETINYEPPPVCGDNKCQSPENATNCAKDCTINPPQPVCGDNKCESPENSTNCAKDCTITPPPTPDMMQIELLLPANYVTNTTVTTFSVRSERPATCRYSFSSTMVNTLAGYNTMRAFSTVTNGNRDFTVQNVFSTLGRQIQVNETVQIAVTCNESSGQLSYTLMPITYRLDSNTNQQTIRLISPANGTTSNPLTVFTVATDLASDCHYNLSNYILTTTTIFNSMKSFITVSNGNKTHSLPDFFGAIQKTPIGDESYNVAVTCKDLVTNSYTATVFPINYRSSQSGPATLTITVTNPSSPTANITVQSNQEVWCTLEGNPMAGPRTASNYNYTVSGNYTLPFGQNVTEKTVQICCENRAFMSTCVDQKINYNFTEDLTITVTSVNSTKATSYILEFNTDKFAKCAAKMGTTNLALTPGATVPSSSWKSSSVSIPSGVTNFDIACTSIVGTITTANFTVTSDRTPPVISDIITNGKTCDLSKIKFEINATDPSPGSGIDQYTYQLTDNKAVIIVPPTNSSSSQVTIRNLNMTNGADYKIRAIAYDLAGNPSVYREEIVKATGPSDSSCDNNPPEVRAVQIVSGGKTNVSLLCSDNGGSGCASSFKYTLTSVNTSSVCNVNSSSPTASFSDTIVVDKESYLCYLALDLAGNELRSQVRIYVNNSNPPTVSPPINLSSGTCNDGILNRDETDVDCGGYSCGKLLKRLCEANQNCSLGADCSSGVCTAGKCVAGGCSNGIRDSGESDIDCGGSCTACQADKNCLSSTDCSAGLRCVNGVCSINPESQSPDYNTEEDINYDESSGTNWWKLILILLGMTLLIGGSGYAVLYEQPKPPSPRSGSSAFGQNSSAISAFPPPGREHGDEISTRHPNPEAEAEQTTTRLREKIAERRSHRDDKIKAFDSSSSFEEHPKVEHHEIEQAVKTLPAKEVKSSLKTMAESGKVSQKDIVIAVKDLENSGDLDMSAIDDLKKEFNIGHPSNAKDAKQETPKKKSIKSKKKKQ